MFSDIKMVFIGIIFLIIGGGIGYVITWGSYRVIISDLKREKIEADLAKDTMKVQWELAVNELNKTQVVLNDTYAALELLKKYQKVDRDVEKDIAKLDDTLDDDGKATEDTYQNFRDMMEEFNQLNGNIPTAANGDLLKILDLKPFEELTKDAEELFKKVTDMVLEHES